MKRTTLTLLNALLESDFNENNQSSALNLLTNELCAKYRSYETFFVDNLRFFLDLIFFVKPGLGNSHNSSPASKVLDNSLNELNKSSASSGCQSFSIVPDGILNGLRLTFVHYIVNTVPLKLLFGCDLFRLINELIEAKSLLFLPQSYNVDRILCRCHYHLR